MINFDRAATAMLNFDPEKLIPGDWLLIGYGGDDFFYVLENDIKRKSTVMCMVGWLVSSSKAFSYAELGGHLKAVYFGRTQKRWWLTLVPVFMRDMFCPFNVPKLAKNTFVFKDTMTRSMIKIIRDMNQS